MRVRKKISDNLPHSHIAIIIIIVTVAIIVTITMAIIIGVAIGDVLQCYEMADFSKLVRFGEGLPSATEDSNQVVVL